MSNETEAQAAAAHFRSEHHLGNGPLGDLATLIEQTTGHQVAVVKVDDPNEHGLTMWDPKRNVTFIAVACTPNFMRQRSSLAHELAHALFRDWSTREADQLSNRSPSEIRADAFARHFLLPVDGLRELLGAPTGDLDPIDFSQVIQDFRVSPSLASIALCSAGFISEETKKVWMKTTTSAWATRFGWIDHYRSLQIESQCPRVPQRLLAAAVRGYEAGVVTVATIATLRGIDADTARQELEDAGIVPTPPLVREPSANEIHNVEVDFSDWPAELEDDKE